MFQHGSTPDSDYQAAYLDGGTVELDEGRLFLFHASSREIGVDRANRGHGSELRKDGLH
jgi:hypothetical protein